MLLSKPRRAHGDCGSCIWTSTFLARSFDEALSYEASGEAKLRFGLLRCYPYEKRLESDSYSTVR